jgi:uroporphyrinogen-III synthase
MAVNSSLTGWNVLVTRPEQQAKNLCDLLWQSGGQAIVFPTLKIVPANAARAAINLAEFDVIIFVSRNSVTYFADEVKEKSLPSTLLVSVGKGSAESMRLHGLRVDVQPDQSIGSEGLLLMPELANMSGKKVLIVRGKGGRELLANTLVQRGAEVEYIEVYERTLTSPSHEQCQHALAANCIVCTSVVGVENLSLLLPEGLKILLDKPMLVMSERIKNHAVSLGFKHVVVTDTSSDNAVIEQLTKMDIE